LKIRLDRVHRAVRVGSLGQLDFSPGWYLYVGSANLGFDARLRRHLRKKKRRFWHIDYLLSLAGTEIEEVWITNKLSECELARRVMELPGSQIVKKGFGASDCRCPAHLCYFSVGPDLKHCFKNEIERVL
jgi:sugar fermentation stimulation protein A